MTGRSTPDSSIWRPSVGALAAYNALVHVAVRIAIALGVLVVAMISALGLLASMEPGISAAWKLAYGVTLAASLVCLFWLAAGWRRI